MCERFPKCFSEFSPQPLKIGIYEDIIPRCPDIELKFLKLFLRFYTQNIYYRKFLLEGSIRIDLDGNPHGAVSIEEAVHAREHYKRSRNAFFKRKRVAAKAEQQASA